jgi:hypothetical protein
MVLSGEPLSGFGFLRSASPGAASRRGDSQSAADPAGLRRIAHRARRPVGERQFFRDPYCIE